MTVGVSLLIAGATGVTVGAAAYSRNAAANSAAIVPAAAFSGSLSDQASSAQGDLVRSDEEDRGRAEGPVAAAKAAAADAGATEVIPGLAVKVGELRLDTDPSGVKATSLPLNVTNTGVVTRSFDITVVAVGDEGKVITSDVGTATDLRPGQSAEVQVLEIVDNTFADELAGATFRVEDAFAY